MRRTKKKASPQLPTKTHKKTTGQSLYEQLSPEWQKAVQLRLDFHRIWEITRFNIGLKYDTLREGFATGGIAHDAYETLKAERAAEDLEANSEVDNMIVEALPVAIRTLATKAQTNWKAAESLAHIAGRTPKQKIEVEVENNTVDKLAEIVKGLENDARTSLVATNKKTG